MQESCQGLLQCAGQPLESHHVRPRRRNGTFQSGRLRLCHECHLTLEKLLSALQARNLEEWLWITEGGNKCKEAQLRLLRNGTCYALQHSRQTDFCTQEDQSANVESGQLATVLKPTTFLKDSHVVSSQVTEAICIRRRIKGYASKVYDPQETRSEMRCPHA